MLRESESSESAARKPWTLYPAFTVPRAGKEIKEVPTHTIHYGYIYDGEEIVDEVLVMVMRAPKTFTGEDTVEIDCHGGVYA